MVSIWLVVCCNANMTWNLEVRSLLHDFMLGN